RVHRLVQIHAERLVGVQTPCNTDQALRKVGVNTPIACFVGVGQSALGNALGPNAHVVELRGLGAQACFDLAQALAKRELGKRHAKELIQAAETPDFEFAPITFDASTKDRKSTRLNSSHEWI